MIEPLGLPRPGLVWQAEPYGRRKVVPVNELTRMLRQMFGRIGRPDVGAMVTDRDDQVDGRLVSLEQEQREIDARLRRLEIQSRRE